LLPAGTLREPPEGLSRADVVLFNGAQSEEAVASAAARVRRYLREDAIVGGLSRSVEVVDTLGVGRSAPGGRALLVSAIARPDRFESAIASQGVEIGASLRYPDHHPFDATDASRIGAAVARHCCDALVCTEKDWVKLDGFAWEGIEVAIARLRVEPFGRGVLEKIKKPRA
jgi:tetraacyldisaccharide 4'-kinase